MWTLELFCRKTSWLDIVLHITENENDRKRRTTAFASVCEFQTIAIKLSEWMNCTKKKFRYKGQSPKTNRKCLLRRCFFMIPFDVSPFSLNLSLSVCMSFVFCLFFFSVAKTLNPSFRPASSRLLPLIDILRTFLWSLSLSAIFFPFHH